MIAITSRHRSNRLPMTNIKHFFSALNVVALSGFAAFRTAIRIILLIVCVYKTVGFKTVKHLIYS